jgi:hypothetical protein
LKTGTPVRDVSAVLCVSSVEAYIPRKIAFCTLTVQVVDMWLGRVKWEGGQVGRRRPLAFVVVRGDNDDRWPCVTGHQLRALGQRIAVRAR